MFSGIIESLGTVRMIHLEGKNVHFHIEHKFDDAPYVDQSISHNGVCLTVNKIIEDRYIVTAIDETLGRTNLIDLSPGDPVNLERSVRPTSFLDGHIVQGHVDALGHCEEIEGRDGSWLYTFSYDAKYAGLLVDKGSIAVNGISLTLIEPGKDSFQVAIIPHTRRHTNLKEVVKGDRVNLEFDIIGKYVQRQSAGT